MKDSLALNISASGSWYLLCLARSTKHKAKNIILSTVYVQLKHILGLLLPVWLSPTGTLSHKRHTVYYSSVNKVLEGNSNLFSVGGKTQPKQMWQELPAQIATRESFTSQPTAEASPHKPCAGSCTSLAAS